MSAPPYVPTRPARALRTYSSSPRLEEGWRPTRPGEVAGRQPAGPRLGSQGPDPGYALTLAGRFRDRLHLQAGEHPEDAIAGATAVALKRASGAGRAPILADLTIGFTIWGFLDAKPDKRLLEARHHLFEECRVPHNYAKLRAIADAVPADVLNQPHQAVLDQYRDGWNQVIQLDHTA